KIVGNFELRSKLFKFFEGAAFFDFGNIWSNKSSSRPAETGFYTAKFLKDIAIGGGLGIRLNFGFFIFRIDGAVRIYDPALDEPYRWVYSHESVSTRDINFNFGIGYPF